MTIGQRVFFIDVNPYDEILYSGILTSEVHQYNNKYFHTIVDVRNESFNQVCYGHRHAYEEDCFIGCGPVFPGGIGPCRSGQTGNLHLYPAGRHDDRPAAARRRMDALDDGFSRKRRRAGGGRLHA